MEVLEKWFRQKYNLPSNHDLFLSRTKFDLLTEFWEDHYDANPLEAHRNEDGHVQFRDTGDPLIDKWEQQIADGQMPDLLEDFTEEQLDKLQKLRSKGRSRMPQELHSMRDTVEKVTREHQGASQAPGAPVTPFPSTFGDGTDTW